MTQLCNAIVFSNRAYNAIIDETFKKDPIETGGILLGHVMEDGIWLVMEVLPPGIHSTHQFAYFEPDKEFINYLSNSVASKYEEQLSLLGLWHRHPGSMDYFSNTDDSTNLMFAEMRPEGTISGLVNVDPAFRLTMRHVSSPLRYEIVDFEVGDEIIPEKFFKLRHYPESGLHPEPYNQQSDTEKKNSETFIVPTSEQPSNMDPTSKDNKCSREKKKSFRNKLWYWAEKVLMIIGAITLLYLILFSSRTPKNHSGVENKVQINRVKELKNNKSKNSEKNGRIEKTQKNPNDQSASRVGVQ